MADIELIPRDYAAFRQLRRRLKQVGIALALLLAIAGGGRAWLAWRIAAERPIVDSLELSAKTATERQARLAGLQSKKAEADAHSVRLRALRDGAAWETTFRAIDAAPSPNLWFEALSYLRELPVEPPSAAPSSTAATAPPTLRYSFEIQGHALANPAITDFMRALGGQPGVSGVRLAETSLRRLAGLEVVDFRLTGTLDPTRKAGP